MIACVHTTESRLVRYSLNIRVSDPKSEDDVTKCSKSQTRPSATTTNVDPKRQLISSLGNSSQEPVPYPTNLPHANRQSHVAHVGPHPAVDLQPPALHFVPSAKLS